MEMAGKKVNVWRENNDSVLRSDQFLVITTFDILEKKEKRSKRSRRWRRR